MGAASNHGLRVGEEGAAMKDSESETIFHYLARLESARIVMASMAEWMEGHFCPEECAFCKLGREKVAAYKEWKKGEKA